MLVIGSLGLLALGLVVWLALGWHGIGLVLMIVGAVGAVMGVLGLVLSARRGRRPPAQPL